ncbi:hypothetical protein RND81_10G137100 [Saponaria officinalis]|uniref:2-hydroxyflavanone C-glucosyltransferase n=2 Tax=Saponaria officinalis TaxID=3572 RepID=A0AAW1I4J5_SAPOF
MKEVMLFPVPAAGHMNPMFHVAQSLHSKGISITIILTNYNSPNPSHFPPDYTFLFIDDGLVASEIHTDPVSRLLALSTKAERPFRDCLASVFSSEKRRKSVACLITDPFWRFTRVVSEEFGVPRIMLHTSTVTDLVILSSPDVLQHEDYSKLPVAIEMVDEIKPSSGLICNSFEELESASLEALRKNIDIPVFPIGPLHKYSKTSATSFLIQDKTPIISWLDKQAPKSVLYVSFGSIATISRAEFQEIAAGLADSKQSFLWVIRPDLVQGSENAQLILQDFDEKIGERGHIVAWAPQQEVLAHPAVGGAFMHGGWNSALESISEGVPVICMPCLFPDQKTIAGLVSEVWKVGLRVKRGDTRGQIKEAVIRLMSDQQIREKMEAFKETVDKCLVNGGSSYKSLNELCAMISAL